MAYRTWQIEHRGEFRLALRRATSLPRGNKRDYVSYKTLVRWRFACALRGSARGFWFIDPLGLRPRGLCTVATRACHVNHAPPSYNYNIDFAKPMFGLAISGGKQQVGELFHGQSTLERRDQVSAHAYYIQRAVSRPDLAPFDDEQ